MTRPLAAVTFTIAALFVVTGALTGALEYLVAGLFIYAIAGAAYLLAEVVSPERPMPQSRVVPLIDTARASRPSDDGDRGAF